MARGNRSGGRNGKWVVVTLLALGLVLAAVGVKYRVWMPPPAQHPTSQPGGPGGPANTPR